MSQVKAHTFKEHDQYEIWHEKSQTTNFRLYLMMKRFLDLFGSIVGLIICAPLFILISMLYMQKESRGPVFFKQKRIGKDGRIFYIYKFRSMKVNAEQILKEDKVLYKKYIDNNYKLEQHEDPRITRIGGFLRKTSLDELPQFINVLKGEMSLIGPRPIITSELKEYGERAKDFLAVKPGLTGFWQISGRSEVGYPERVDLELHYVYNQSLSFDLKIIFKTVYIVLLKKGAY